MLNFASCAVDKDAKQDRVGSMHGGAYIDGACRRYSIIFRAS